MRRVLTVLLAALALLAPPASAQDTAAVAVNTKDGRTVFDLAFAIHRITNGDVDATNIAFAYASCETCQTVAISIQVVLVGSTADVIAPVNAAIAMNEDCVECQTLASAYQWVLALGTPVRLTDEGWRQIADIRVALNSLRTEDISVEEIQSRVDELMDRLGDVLTEEVVPIREPEPTASPSASPTPGASPTATAPEQTGTPTASATPSATATASPSPTPSQSPTATATP